MGVSEALGKNEAHLGPATYPNIVSVLNNSYARSAASITPSPTLSSAFVSITSFLSFASEGPCRARAFLASSKKAG